MDEHLAGKVVTLRAEGMAPKAIARMLGTTVAEVVAALNDAVPGGDGGEPRCWVSAGWSFGLGLEATPGWAAHDRPSVDAERGGLVAVLVARSSEHASRAQVAGFLLDVWCLGAKDVQPADAMSHTELAEYRQLFFGTFDSFLPVPAALARDLVFGSVAYARALGFMPHDDFEDAAGVLGEPADPPAIRFGRDGRPFYMDGPHDDPAYVLQTLERTVGKDGFGYVVEAPDIPRTRLPDGGTGPGRPRPGVITPSSRADR